jgi:hypothetical protein
MFLFIRSFQSTTINKQIAFYHVIKANKHTELPHFSCFKTVCSCYFQRCRLLVRNSLCSTSNWQPPLQTSSTHWPLGRNQRNDQEAKLLHSGQLNCKIHKAENLFSSKLKQNFPRWVLNKLYNLTENKMPKNYELLHCLYVLTDKSNFISWC